MKQILYIISLLLVPVWILAQTTTQNYVLSKTYQDANASSSLDVIQYFDGLGRPVETVQKGVTPTGGDLVYLTEYDGVGREYKKWLPIVWGNGAYVTPTTITGGSPKSYYNYDMKIYETIEYENSPLNRITGQYGAGSSWYTSLKKKNVNYQANSATEVPYFFINSSNKLERSGNYAINVLYKTQTTDEDGKIAVEFKNKLGQVVMTQSSTNVKTCYVQNDLGQLTYVLPPIAIDSLPQSGQISDNNGVLKRYAYFYKYDERGNNVVKQLPGCDSICMVYDKADHMVLSQDGNQRQKNKWIVTKYDIFGRVLYTGLINNSSTRVQFKALVKNQLIVEAYDGTTGFFNTGYTCTGSLTGITPLTVSYYDNYRFRRMLSETDSIKLKDIDVAGYDSRYSNAKGMLTGTRTYILDKSGKYLTTALYYDDKAQIVQTRATNHLGGYDLIYNHFDFAGKLLKLKHTHSIVNATELDEITRNEYDLAGRLTKVRYKIGQSDTITLAQYSYDEIGRPITKFRHNLTDTEQFQYNVRNWLTKITSGTSFTEELFYNTSTYSNTTPCFNGNIAATTWTYNGVKKGYAYNYDDLNRLTTATAYSVFGTTTFYSAKNMEQFSYDKQGNIINLWRQNDATFIDYVHMSYLGNQITSAYDNYGSQNQYAVKEYNNKSTTNVDEFSYDKNGNMIKDLDREIVTIKYNILNLPDTIQFKYGNQIKNIYDASGRKLESDYYTLITGLSVPLIEGQVVDPMYLATNYSLLTGTDYLGNIEYSFSNDQGDYQFDLDKIYNTEGYSVSPTSAVYYYYRKDHLGNNREVWCANTNNNVQRTQYYPSGLPWMSNTGDNPGTQTHKYNGKEFVEMHGYDTYDFGWRGHYAALNRFTTLDRFAEKYPWQSPYCVAANNPVRYIDIMGDSINAEQQEGQEMMTNTLTEEDAQYVQFNEDGDIDMDLLLSHSSDSENYNNLVTLATSDLWTLVSLVDDKIQYTDNNGKTQELPMTYQGIDVSWADPTGGKDINSTSKGDVGRGGVTLLPGQGVSTVNSPDDNIRVFVSRKFTKEGQAEMYSHEANGHALMYVNTRDRKMSAHPADKKNIPLINMILKSKSETVKNMKSR
ncbi:MAG: DUF6443 domain-containing protein [Paludibacter sp.]|nr:DUF6443 domain-containing protein [Paludibacter sp.]